MAVTQNLISLDAYHRSTPGDKIYVNDLSYFSKKDDESSIMLLKLFTIIPILYLLNRLVTVVNLLVGILLVSIVTNVELNVKNFSIKLILYYG